MRPDVGLGSIISRRATLTPNRTGPELEYIINDSGDAGCFDDEDFLFICDRVKDMVIAGGENVYPAQVGGVLCAHEAVAEVAVIGLPDDKWGEAVTAVVVIEEGRDLSLEKLRGSLQVTRLTELKGHACGG